MELIIQETMKKIISKSQENFIEMLETGENITFYVEKTKELVEELGRVIIKEAIEMVDEQIKVTKKRKKDWYIQRKNDEKTLITILGEVKYNRTYYKHKKTKEYCYLADDKLGIKPHERMDLSVKKKIIEEVANTSYEKTSKKVIDTVKFSKQTVMNVIRKMGKIENNLFDIEEAKKEVKVLYIDADEDHVALQDGRNVEPKLIYVHEGYVDDTEKRKKLRNVKYFTALQGNTEDLWLEVADYIDKKYNVEKIDKIYLSGDGAWWIKEGLNWIPKSKYVLDYFHLSKYVRVAIAQKPEYTMELWKNINKRDKKETMKLLSKIIKETEIETKKEAIKNVKKYITRNWEGIENRYEKEYIGCSAEGHISHIIADRMSSRPLGWCELGADQMVRLRVYIANGGKVSELLKRKEISKRKNKNDIKINYRSVNKKVQEQIDNIPSITQGKRTWEYRLMNSLRFA